MPMIKRKILAAVVILMVLFTYSAAAFGEPNTAGTSVPPELKSQYAILTDQKTGKVLYEKDSHQKAYPASLTKILTALLILENVDMKENITVGKEIQLVEQDASDAGLFEGEQLTGADLLWALMLPSGNDAAYTAAVHIARKKSGNSSMDIPEAVKYFADMMNKRAHEIGAKESNFVNPDGYPHDDHYSTAYDMALISREAMKQDFLREVVGTYTYEKSYNTDSGTESKKTTITWYNKNQMINKKSKYYYEFAKGIKTGHTSAAGYCLASYAEMDDRAFISVVMKAGTEETRWLETTALFQYGFNNFKQHTFMKKGDTISSAKVIRKYFGDSADVNILSASEYTDVLTDKDIAGVKRSIEWDKSLLKSGEADAAQIKLVGPISAGQVVGKVTYTLDGKVLSQSELVASGDALKGDFTDKIVGILDSVIANKIIILICLAAAVILIAILVLYLKRGRKAQ